MNRPRRPKTRTPHARAWSGGGDFSRVEYNERGAVTRTTDPLGRETVFTYAANETDLLNVKQKNGSTYDLLWSATYNTAHRPLTVTDAAGQVTTYSYNANGTVATIVSPPRGGLSAADRTTTFNYFADNAASGAGRKQTIVGPLTTTTTFTYDAYGRVRTSTSPDGHAVTFDYDALDRRTRATYADGTYRETLYNRLDVERERDRLGRWTHHFYDATGRLLSTRDPLGRTVRAEQSCNCGSLDKFIDSNGNATTWERDLQGRVTREVRADGSDRLFVYENTTSRMKEVKDAFATRQVKGYEYFADGNIKRLTYTNEVNATTDVQFTYDAAYNRPSTMVDGTGTTTYTYHAVGSPPAVGAGQLASVDGPLSNDTITYSYDEIGRPWKREINGTANSLTYVFDALDRPITETNLLGSFSTSYAGVTARASVITFPNGQTVNLDYFDHLGDDRLKQIHNKKSGGATLSKFDYTYDVVGNIKTWTQQYDAAAAKTLTFQYDLAEQLVSASRNPTDATLLDRFAYAYDPAGNRTAEQLDDAVTGATYNTMNRLTSAQPGGALRFRGTLNEAGTVTVDGKPAQLSAANEFDGSAIVGSGTSSVQVVATDPANNTRTNTYQVSQSGSTKSYTYDANGNMTGDGSKSYAWDADNRLVLIRSGANCTSAGTSCTEFTYDGKGRRVRIVEKIDGATTSDKRLLWCDREICEERDATGATVTKRFFTHGVKSGSTDYFYTRDHLGSVVEMTDTSAALGARYDYDAFGRTTKVAGTLEADFGFTGHYAHRSTGLALALYRAYDPTSARWLSEDPARANARISLYAYVLNNPARYTDVFGLAASEKKCCEPDLKKVVQTVCEDVEDHPQVVRGVKNCITKKCKEKKWEIFCGNSDFCNNSAGNEDKYGVTLGNNDIIICPLMFSDPPCNNPAKNVILHEMMHNCTPNLNGDWKHEYIPGWVRKVYPCGGL